MPLRNLIKKKEQIKSDPAPPVQTQSPPEFTFIRSTTTMQEVIMPPSHPDDDQITEPKEESNDSRNSKNPLRHFRKSSKQTVTPSTSTTAKEREIASETSKDDIRGSHRLHLRSHSRSASQNSSHVPEDLPAISTATGISDETAEAQWEKRATLLAQKNESSRPNSAQSERVTGEDAKSQHQRNISDAKGDGDIQEAIRLHEEGRLEESTAMFGRLANPDGQNNALAQVLYGLALRHGWGVTKSPEKAVTYISRAASNSAAVESSALEAGKQKGGAAKGELVLAIYELANTFRHGWGVEKDPVAARQYYETAANLGDTDAMNEIARCYLEGFGGKKDKYKAAQYLRMAESKGSQTFGNSWIWKEKYNPKP